MKGGKKYRYGWNKNYLHYQVQKRCQFLFFIKWWKTVYTTTDHGVALKVLGFFNYDKPAGVHIEL